MVEFFEVFENLTSGLLLGVSEGVSDLKRLFLCSHLSDFFVDFAKTEGIELGIMPEAVFTAFLLTVLGLGGFSL